MSDPQHPPYPAFNAIIDVPPSGVERSPTQPPPPPPSAAASPPPSAARSPTPSAARSPTPEAVVMTRNYFIDLREDLQRQVATIEAFLGFTDQTTDLQVRIAKIEAFLGLKG